MTEESEVMNVYFAHGKESGPWGTKIEALAEIAKMKGFSVESPDYSDQPDPDARVEQFLSMNLPASDLTVLVGSSMGGYVVTVASQAINPVGLFLMAPAFFIPGYMEQSPTPHARKTVIVHGLQDDVVPVENSVRFAREHNTELHLIDSGHRLNDQLPMIEMLFAKFLDDVLELSDLPKTLTYDEISQKLDTLSFWVELHWAKMVSAGLASYSTDVELNHVRLRYNLLANFYYAFLDNLKRYEFMNPVQDTDIGFSLPQMFLDGLLADFITRRGYDLKEERDIQMVMEEIAKEYVYPVIMEHSEADFETVAALLCQYSAPLDCYEESHGFITDPEEVEEDTYEYNIEDSEEEGLSEKAELEMIKKWLAGKFSSQA